jgi:hypothetical protein
MGISAATMEISVEGLQKIINRAGGMAQVL